MKYLIYCNGTNKSYNWLGKKSATVAKIFRTPEEGDQCEVIQQRKGVYLLKAGDRYLFADPMKPKVNNG